MTRVDKKHSPKHGGHSHSPKHGAASNSPKPVEPAAFQLDPIDTAEIELMRKRKEVIEQKIEDMERAMLAMTEAEEANAPQARYSNRYTTKKTISKGMLDLGLLMVNVAQLKLLVSLGPGRLDYFWINVVLIILSIVLQIVVGVILALLGASTVKTPKDKKQANNLNNVSLGLIFVITTLNTIIAAVGVSETNHPIPVGGAQNNQYGVTAANSATVGQ